MTAWGLPTSQVPKGQKEDTQAAASSDLVDDEDEYLQQRDAAWNHTRPASTEVDLRARDRAQQQWDEEQVEYQSKLWEQVQRQRQAEQAAARYKAWEDWVVYTEMHAPPQRAGTQVRVRVAVPG